MIPRPDVIIVASVSAIYGIGNPADYHQMVMTLRVGDKLAYSASSIDTVAGTMYPGTRVATSRRIASDVSNEPSCRVT